MNLNECTENYSSFLKYRYVICISNITITGHPGPFLKWKYDIKRGVATLGGGGKINLAVFLLT